MASEDILNIYEKIVGEKLDLNIDPSEDEEDYWKIWAKKAVLL